MSKAYDQYRQLKSKYPHAILFFQLGDFYETFGDDARIVSEVCGIMLTARELGRGNRMPLAGVPVHSANSYIARLLKAGHRVALCQQLSSEPSKGSSVVERDIVRIITPGTVNDESLLNDKTNNYILSLAIRRRLIGLACADVTTGEFHVTQLTEEDWRQIVRAELERLRPAEVLLEREPETTAKPMRAEELLPDGAAVTRLDSWYYQLEPGREALQRQFGVASLEGFGFERQPAAIEAAGALLQYLQETQKASLSRLDLPRWYSTASYMHLDASTQRNLELTQAGRQGGARSLLSVLDKTLTPGGGRLLRRWLGQPLHAVEPLNQRLGCVTELVAAGRHRAELRELLRGVGDPERLLARLASNARPVDLLTLKGSLTRLPALKQLWQMQSTAGPIGRLLYSLDDCTEVVTLIEQAIDENESAGDSSRRIRRGFAPELDELLESTREAREWIASLEQVEKERTGVKALRVGYNKVFGYYIEVSNAALEAPLQTSQLQTRLDGSLTATLEAGSVPANIREFLEKHCGYVRKQTLVSAERFITEKLEEYELLVLEARERIEEMESRIFAEVCVQVSAAAERIVTNSRLLAELDIYASFAEVAVAHNYCRPQLDEGESIEIEAGRHPVVEQSLPPGAFVANNSRLDLDSEQLIILTGPNMAGKSTYLRQVALIVLMAQIGCYVPARRARIGLVDRIFTRVGAQDDIATGQSTFMVEMSETATILNHATRRSLVILDEVGRGTSTYDGMALATAIVEYIHNHPRLGCKTLFATHYHELTDLEKVLPRLRNQRMQVSEEAGTVTFLHRVEYGVSDRSYGVYVARLAGIPRAITQRAQDILVSLERSGQTASLPEATATAEANPAQLAMLAEPDPLLAEIAAIDLNAISPLEALNRLYLLQQQLKERG